MPTLILALFLTFTPLLSFAQTEAATSIPAATVLATVSVQDAQIVKQEGNQFTIDFKLSNRVGIQPDVHYAVRLIKTSEDSQQLIDSHVYPEALYLGENSHINKTIVYQAPTYLSGSYELWLESKTGSGLPLGITRIGDIELLGDQQAVQIVDTYCYLTVVGEANQSHYTLTQGVDILPTENLVLNCTAINQTNANLALTPQFTTHHRTIFGAVVETPSDTVAPFALKALAKETITIPLPKAKVPQAYDIEVTFTTEPHLPVTPVVVHYVLRGASATIQNIIADKSSYQAGEIAKISFMGSLSADGFPDSRIGTGTPITQPLVKLNLINQQGEQCGDEVSLPLTEQILNQVEVPIKNVCALQQVQAVIADETGTVLASDNLAFNQKATTTVVSTPNPTNSNLAKIAITIIVLLLMLFIFIKYFKRDTVTEEVNTSAGAGLMMLFILVTGVMLPGEVRGDSFGVGPATYTVNLNKSVYLVGESITTTARIDTSVCTNTNPNFNLTVTVNGVTKNLGSFNPVLSRTTVFSSAYPTAYFPGPSSPGNYFARFTGTYSYNYFNSNRAVNAWVSGSLSATYSIPYTVIPNPTPGSCAYANGGSYTNVPASGQCAQGASSGPVANGATWNWSCSGTNGGAAAACSANRIIPVDGACGSDNGGTFNVPPTNICSIGAATAVNNNGSTWGWSCLGSSGGNNVNCSATRSVSCTGITPANATIYVGDDTSLLANTGKTYSAVNTATKCQYSCTAGFNWNGTSCVPPVSVFSCTGATPANATIYFGDDTSLLANTGKSYSAVNTATKCQYSCTAGFNWNGTSCVPPPPALPGSCGTANGLSFPNGTAGYAPTTQCSSGSASNTTFPVAGATVSWTLVEPQSLVHALHHLRFHRWSESTTHPPPTPNSSASPRPPSPSLSVLHSTLTSTPLILMQEIR